MDTIGNPYCLMFGAIISFVVSVMKRWSFIRNNPKMVALVLNAAVGAYVATHGSAAGIDYAAIMQCILAQFAASVTTHEVITKPITNTFKSPE